LPDISVCDLRGDPAFIKIDNLAMRIVHTIEELAGANRDICLAIGVFDGVHIGHQRVIGQAMDDARCRNGLAVALTFDPHPVRFLQPDRAPLLLTSTSHKLRLMTKLGLDACVVMTFDASFAATPPERFIERIVQAARRLRVICVGTRFRFGHNRTGDIRLIENLAPEHGYVAREIEPVTVNGESVSSTVIRKMVMTGDLGRAAAMLGRPFSILGTVEHGDGLGRQIGYPTANIDPHNEAIPAHGVYVARARLGDDTLAGIVNIGVRPTFNRPEPERTIEIHLLNFGGDIYGRELEIEFLWKLRDEQKFPTVDALQSQIARDEINARQWLEKHGVANTQP
jgi:riboflavin kinase/FMN adenylyltransferase